MAVNEQILPHFAFGKYSSLLSAISEGGKYENLDRAMYYYATDTKFFYFVKPDKSINSIKGDNTDEINALDERVTSLEEGMDNYYTKDILDEKLGSIINQTDPETGEPITTEQVIEKKTEEQVTEALTNV